MDVVLRNNVKVSGRPDGRAMIFAHGFGCDQHMWRFVAPAFEADHRVVVFDHVGAGASALAAYDPERYRSLSDGVVETLPAGLLERDSAADDVCLLSFRLSAHVCA